MDPRTARVVASATCAFALAALLSDLDSALAGPRGRAAARVGRVETPLGLQGTRGAALTALGDVVVPFTLLDSSRRRNDVEVEYGVDIDRDGVIGEHEYRPCTEDRHDSRDTRRNKRRQLFTSAGDIGAAHAFVWSSVADVASQRYEILEYRYTPQGRPVPDLDNPGQFEFASEQPGLRVRARAVLGKGRRRIVGEWTYSDRFSLNNNHVPSMTIDAVLPNATSTPAASDEVVEVLWTGIDADSEDQDGDGALGPTEDRNGNGLPDFEPLAVAFDFYRLQGESPQSMTDEQLAALKWLPCTRKEGAGDPDGYVEGDPAYPGVPSSPVGRQYTFAWDSVRDAGTVHAQFILRARPFDAKRENGGYAYLRTPFTVDNWKIWNSAGPSSSLPEGRVGLTLTNLLPGLSRSDPLYPEPFQAAIAAGGAASATSNAGTAGVAVLLVNTETSETSTAQRVTFAGFARPRAWHSATLLDDGRVLFAGGFDAAGVPTTSTEIYDPLTRSMQEGPDLLVARARHAAVKLASGDVAFFGGVGASGQPLASAEICNVSPFGQPLEAGTALPALAVAQHSLHAILLPDQRVLVTGGIDAAGAAVRTAQLLEPLHDDDVLDPAKNPRFVPAGQMLEARRHGAAVPLVEGHVLFAGGASSPSKPTLEIFNWQTAAFEPVAASMPGGGRAQMVATRLGDGSVLLAGGTADPDQASAALIPGGDILVLGARDGATGTWSASFRATNGDMVAPRRAAAAAAITNGRVLVAGGVTATGTTATLEFYTPEGGRNVRPTAQVVLASSQQSWKYGAPIFYRLSDPELDRARVVVQWSNDGQVRWNACAPAADTIGGDVAEPAANLLTAAAQNPNLPIDPVQKSTLGDHIYIWQMSSDIPRPAPGTSQGGYNMRVVPFGAVQGRIGVSDPVEVLYNTKVIATILPFEDKATGALDPNQGGDVRLWVHVRDVDGIGAGSVGDASSVFFEYAVDQNQDGLISGADNEFWFPMTPSGKPVGVPSSGNPRTGLTSYSESFEDSSPEFGARPSALGWTSFDWDSVFDLGAPPADRRDVWVRVTPSDTDVGFPRAIRNRPGQPDELVLVRHPDALWLADWAPRGGDTAAVKANEPIDFFFNGVVDPASVTPTTLRIFRGAAQVLGVYVTAQTGPRSSVVTFHPQPQNTVNDQPVYSAGSNPTVLLPSNEYRITIPGYAAGQDPRNGTMLRPLGQSFPGTTSTYLLVQNLARNGDTDATLRFGVAPGYYDDGTAVARTSSAPVGGSTLSSTPSLSFTFDHAVDAASVRSPNLTVRGTTGAAPWVVPGRWTVTNTVNPDGTTSSTATFSPLLRLPSGGALQVLSATGLVGSNGRTVQPFSSAYTVTAYGRTSTTATESFSNTNQEDTSYTTSAWGDDPCAPGAITGLQDASTGPQGGSALVVKAGTTFTISSTTSDYDSITVEKGGTLVIKANSAPTIRVKKDFKIDGRVTFAGEPGYSGHFGTTSSSYTYYYYGSLQTSGTRKGGAGYNGGGAGGDSVTSSSNNGTNVGNNGSGSAGGQGGQTASSSYSTAYYFGAGGGAGAGHATPGLAGGRNTWYQTSSIYGAISTPGGVVGDAKFAGGLTAGSGGGGGAMTKYSSWAHMGGGGGSGAGAVQFVVDGDFVVGPTGFVDGRGGQGGSSAHWAGAGGGGSGGGLHVKCGGRAVLDGVIDLRGGRGGPLSLAEGQDYYSYINGTYYGSVRYGGDGGLGRLYIEAANYTKVDEVRVFGQLVIKQVTTIPASAISSPSTPPSAFSGTGTGTFTYDFGTASEVYWTSLSVPAGRTVNLKGTKAVRIFVRDTVSINGRIVLNGESAPTTGGYPEDVSSPYYGGHVGGTSADSKIKGYLGNLGGGNGGDPHNNSSGAALSREATDGTGPAPGRHRIQTNPGWSNYYTGDSGGGGGANATDGIEGWAPYAMPGIYNYYGATNDTTGTGILAQNGGAPGTRLDATLLSVTNLDSFVGSGGGGGNAGGYYTYGYGWAGKGGAGAGALAIVTPNSLSVGGTVTGGVQPGIEARGGDGNQPGMTGMYIQVWDWSNSTYTTSAYAHAGGGAGAGGTVLLVADSIDVAKVTTGEGASANGAFFDLSGGMGGGWRQPFTGTPNRYPTYDSAGAFGGDGGFGRLALHYRTSLNGGSTLVNRWGMEQSVFHDAREQYRALAGTFRTNCRGTPGGNLFQSKWYDLASLRPIVNGVTALSTTNVGVLTLQGQGAQSHPHNVGSGGTGEPDPANVSALVNSGASMLDGWRWFRFRGSFTRGAGTAPPTVDDVRWSYETDL